MDFTYPVLIRESHLDTFGHVNNATYLSLYEEARWELVNRNGFGLKEVQEKKIGPVILEANVKFMKELRLREEIQITVELINYNGKIGQIQQRMINSKGEVASEAVFTLGLFDLKERRLIPPTAEWKKAIGLE